MANCAIVGINWGDEGKGRMVDYLAEKYDVVVRYQGGNNAGHTVINEYGKFALNLLPSEMCIRDRQVAEYIGSDHTEVIITKEDVLRALPTVVELLATYDITTIRASVGMYLVCKYIHEYLSLIHI